MTDRIVTLFGGTGFLGRVIATRLAAAGHTVRVAARDPNAASFPEGNGAIERRSADVRDEGAVAAALEGAGAAVNAVGLYVERGAATFEAVHVEGAERVARLARASEVERLVHVSGIGSVASAESAYLRARGRGEEAVQRAFPEATILRPSVIFGPGDAFLSTLEGISQLPVIPLFGDGSIKLQPVHVEDVAAACERALEPPETAGRIFELGGARVLTYREIVETVLERNQRHRPLLPVPFSLWQLLAGVASILPNPPLTCDQVALMQADNVVGEGVGTFAELGIEPREM